MERITNALINPICAACKENIGEMPLDIYLEAVEYRGTFLLCPNCRTHYCDCCGWFIPHQQMRPNFSDGEFVGNSCEPCSDWILPEEALSREDFPHFQLMKKPNLRHIGHPYREPGLKVVSPMEQGANE